jgi:hypothetical protein
MPPADPSPRARSITLAVALTACSGSSGSSDESTATDSSSPTAPTTSAADASTGESTTDPGGACESPRLLARWVVPDLQEEARCFGVGMDDSGDVLFLGGSHGSDYHHAQLVRLADGEVEWSVLHPAANEYVAGLGLAIRGDGVALITGFTDDPGSFQRLPWTATYDHLGNLMSESVVTSDGDPPPPLFDGENHAAVVAASGEFLIAGAQHPPNGTNNRTAVVRRYDPIAGELAVTAFPTPAGDHRDIAHAIALDAGGGVVVLGQTRSATSIYTDLWIARLSADLTLVDIHTRDVGNDDRPRGVAALPDGSIVIAAGGSERYVVRVSADLSPVWSLPGGASGPVLLGDDAIFTVVGDDRIVEKLGFDGEQQWADDPCLDGGSADALALSPDGSLLIVGRTRSYQEVVVELYDARS